MRPNPIKLAGVLLLLCAAFPAHALDSVSLELGRGANTDMGRVGVQWDWNKSWAVGDRLALSGYWDTSLGYWQGDNGEPGAQDIYDLGFTPVFRLSQDKPTGWYAEAGVGLHLLSGTRINDRRRFGSAFQFGNHIGVAGDSAGMANTIWVIACNTCQMPVPANPMMVSTSTRSGFPIILMRHSTK